MSEQKPEFNTNRLNGDLHQYEDEFEPRAALESKGSQQSNSGSRVSLSYRKNQIGRGVRMVNRSRANRGKSISKANRKGGGVQRVVSTIPHPAAKIAAKVLTKQGIGKIKVKAVTNSIRIWGSQLYIWLQLPLAIALLIFLGLSAFIGGDFFIVEEDDWAITRWLKGVGNDVASTARDFAADAVEYLTGITIDPLAIAAMLHGVVFLIGITTLVIMGIQYSLAMIPSLSGKGGVVKMFSLIIALVGYSFPFLNLFPWFFVWAWAVNKYPA